MSSTLKYALGQCATTRLCQVKANIIEVSFRNVLEPALKRAQSVTLTLSRGFMTFSHFLNDPFPYTYHHPSARRILIDAIDELSVVCQERLTCCNNN